ncbi:MAG TPA: hypothetical protein VGK46_06210, partial [Saprospiraceae bacterium]
YEEDLKGRNKDAFKYFVKEYHENPKDLMINTTGMVLASEYLNDPAITLQMFKQIDPESLDLTVCIYCRTKVNMALQAYLDVFDYKNAGMLAEQLKPYAERRAQVSKLILYYLTIGDTATVSDIIRTTSKKDKAEDIQQIYLRYAAQYGLLLGKPDLTRYYANQALTLYGKTQNWKVGRLHFLLGQYNAAEKIYLQEIKKDTDNVNLLAELAVIYARQNKTDKAQSIVTKLEQLKPPYDLGVTPYLQGRIKANMGDPTSAIKYLNQAIDEGIKFGKGTTFHHDPDLIVLFKEPEFLKLLGKNRPTSFPK